ncbi:MAG: deoxyhypusine synthase family protein [Deltaproteobacteria bacterium]|nr:deoxyhypusine synthase family protein [Deltaproteobacteria bacterium]
MRPLEVGAGGTTSELLREMSATAFTGRALGEAADVLEAMIREKAFTVMTLSGAMTMAGLNKLIMEMIRRGWVRVVVATGALVGHGLVEDLGFTHYKANPDVSDEEYLKVRFNRVYDTVEPEHNLERLELTIRGLLHELADARDEPLGSHELLRFLGERLPGHGVLQEAARANVPVFIPAFTDSELGLDVAVHQLMRRRDGKRPLVYDGFRDLFHYVSLCEGHHDAGGKLGIFTIGGGVPRNWAQQLGPYVDIRGSRMGEESPVVRYAYGVRICPDPVHYGHLSGCTYSEGVSWGKFVARGEGGRYAEVLCDATVAWPLLVRAMIERGL